MNLAPARLRHVATQRPNPLRITGAQKAIAAVMNGVDPEPGDLEGLGELRIDAQTLHLSAAAALRQVLLSRPTPGALRTSRHRRRIGTDQHVVRDAYYLALALADCTGPTALAAAIGNICTDWLEPAALVGRLQVRFLEQVCAQIDMTANHLPVVPRLSGVMSRDILAAGGRLAPGTVLLPDHAFDQRDRDEEGSPWLHATSTVMVAGHSGPVIVDAGPDSLTGAWSARIAAPVTVTAAAGRWPVTAVEDCLRLCSAPVRAWVASMDRQLSGEDNEDLSLRIGAPLRQFLISPATVAVTAAVAASRGESPVPALGSGEDVSVSGALPAVPLMPAGRSDERERHPMASTLLPLMRAGGEAGAELAEDTILEGCGYVAEIHRDEMALLSAVSAAELDREVEVTINFSTPQWQDVTALIGDVRATGVMRLGAPVFGRVDQEIIAGARHRLSLRARVTFGVPVHTREGYGVVLPAGTRLALLGADVSKHHTTLYATQRSATPEDVDDAAQKQDVNAA
ncbi:hypothetical protein [Mycolicibacterium aubagnense]|uniref:hypothetical protein n=1 Tax=Mycolicibacterium aubagnense TaxID=319707 RepID=UPI0010FE6A31|nr:hypothetical protein [Mycolicibacterium aubagnense]